MSRYLNPDVDDPKPFATQHQAKTHLRSLGFEFQEGEGWLNNEGQSGSITKRNGQWWACIYTGEQFDE